MYMRNLTIKTHTLIQTYIHSNLHLQTHTYTYTKVSINGIISTIAGTGNVGNSGNGVDATSASLNFPHSIAVDASGNIYIADTDNHKVRKVMCICI